MSNLSPCPFCGSERIDGMYIRDGWRIGCLDCGAGVHAYLPNAHIKASEKWNRRVPQSTPDPHSAASQPMGTNTGDIEFMTAVSGEGSC